MSVHEADAGVVGLETLAAEIVGEFVLFLFIGAESGFWDVGLIFCDVLDDAHRGFVIFFEIGFGGDIGGVWAEEAERKEEGARAILGASFEDPLGVCCVFAVGVFGISLWGCEPTECAAELSGGEGEDLGFFLGAVDTGGVHLDLPGGWVIVTVGTDGFWDVVVEEFADAHGEVSVLSKNLRERGLFGDGLTEDEGVREDAGAIGVEAGEERVPAGAAEREGAIGAIEPHAALCKFVDVGCFGLGIAVAAEEVVQVVADDEKDVFLAGRFGVGWGKACDERGGEGGDADESGGGIGRFHGTGRVNTRGRDWLLESVDPADGACS